MVLMACSDDKGGDTAAQSNAATTAVVSDAGSTQVKVDGSDLPGLDLDSVTCVKQAGRINVASAAIGGQQGIGVVMTDAEPPVVESLGMVVDGTALSVASSAGMQVGSAEVAVDGDTYTITGEAQGADLANPTAGMVTKQFSITVTCG
jgi:lipoprotein LpqH